MIMREFMCRATCMKKAIIERGITIKRVRKFEKEGTMELFP